MDFRILGPLEVRDGEVPLPLGAARERALLAALLLHRTERVSRERLVDLVWGESPPRTVDAVVHNCVSRLRRSLGSERLRREGAGYRIVVEEGELDSDRFEALFGGGQMALAEGAYGRAAALLGEALALFRGDPLEDVRFALFAQGEIRRFGELRVEALEGRIAAELALGREEGLVAELEGLVVAHPWRERFHAQLMLALYRGGRQAEALEAYQAARHALGDGLGLEPGGELQELERRILRQDPTLDLLETAAPTNLPVPASRLVGREQEISELHDLLGGGDVRLLTLVGPGRSRQDSACA